MGFSSLKTKLKAQPKKPVCVIDLSAITGEPEGTTVLRFNEPNTATMFSGQIDDKFKANYPDLMESETLASQLIVLAKMYVPDEDEINEEDGTLTIDPLKELASLARLNRDVFMYVYKEVNTAFPVMDVAKEIENQKNAKPGASSDADNLPAVPASAPVAG